MIGSPIRRQDFTKNFTAIILAAGSGSRCKSSSPKQFDLIKSNLTLLEASIERVIAFAGHLIIALPEKNLIQHNGQSALSLSPDLASLADRLAIQSQKYKVVISFCIGGASRSDSAIAAFSMVQSPFLFIHDAARPLTHPDDLQRLLSHAIEFQAAILASPITNTVKRVVSHSDLQILETLPRECLWAAETPQAFEYNLYAKALKAADPTRVYTDDASLVEAIGRPVKIVPSLYPNPKITYPEDLEWLRCNIEAHSE